MKYIQKYANIYEKLVGGITPVQAISPITTHFFVAWSVSLSSVTVVHTAETIDQI